ncbi:uncharacterized protein LOC121595437 [Anopheles merus]|uniref:uncharacterized protein LOC121595437 n=1 Tax=Anopheles merus TaxID=30066 RepID=UPI001BE3DC00|nr:uncharacterized protein LOC121595437 [Anopheles merus]
MYLTSSHDSSHICQVRNVNKHGQPPVKIVCRIIVKFYVKSREKEKHHFIPKFGNIRPSMIEQLCVCMPTKYDAVSTTITKAGCDRDRHILNWTNTPVVVYLQANQRCHTPQNSMERTLDHRIDKWFLCASVVKKCVVRCIMCFTLFVSLCKWYN